MFLLPINQIYSAEQSLAEKMSGKILLQVEKNGEAWYVNPSDQKRYEMGRPQDAFDLMRSFSFGITNEDLSKIPLGLIDYYDDDNDQDGLPNRLETSLGTDPNNKDSDNDGFNDKEEALNGYDPLSNKKILIDNNFTKKHLGKIFTQVKQNGEAWYINPSDQKRYYLGRPIDAFRIMQKLALGINNQNLEKISQGYINIYKHTEETDKNEENTNIVNNDENILGKIADGIRGNDDYKVLDGFTPNMRPSIEYSLKNMDSEQKLMLANILSGSELTESQQDKKTYSNTIYFQGGYHPAYFHVIKELNGQWYLSNL